MSITLYWLQNGGCGGDTHSFLNVDPLDATTLLELLGVDVLWHPALSNGSANVHQRILDQLLSGRQPLDVLCLEGSILRGPGGTGMYDLMFGKPKKDLLAALAQKARFVVAIGTCASFGGVGAEHEVEAVGMQFLRTAKGGFMGEEFRAGSGLPVINLPGCPCHPSVVAGALSALVAGTPLDLDQYQRPLDWYGIMVHQGCTRNEYHEYRVEEVEFGEKGCLFFHRGCHGPLAQGPCNKLLWNGHSSKTRVGVPCQGCTRPDFPQRYAFFQTRNIEGIPIELPDGIGRAHYLAYKGMAAAAAPQRLRDRTTNI
ncbi:MAG: NADH:ubiquinone oxidoreductase [Acidobacteriota bacterium]